MQHLAAHGENSLVRHECAEALGSIAADEVGTRVDVEGGPARARASCPACSHSGAVVLLSGVRAPSRRQCLPILHQYAADSAQVVKESCEVALDMHAYENSTQFQYADGLQRVEDGTN